MMRGYIVFQLLTCESKLAKKRTAPGNNQEDSEDSDGEDEDLTFPAKVIDCNQFSPHKLTVSICSTEDAYSELKEPLIALMLAL